MRLELEILRHLRGRMRDPPMLISPAQPETQLPSSALSPILLTEGPLLIYKDRESTFLELSTRLVELGLQHS